MAKKRASFWCAHVTYRKLSRESASCKTGALLAASDTESGNCSSYDGQRPMVAMVMKTASSVAQDEGTASAKKRKRQDVDSEAADKPATMVADTGTSKKKKRHLGKKEREKLKRARAVEQAAADEEAGRIAAGGKPSTTGTSAQPSSKADKRSRYTVFVGNLPYDATQQDVFKHFENFLRDMVLDVRMNHDKGTGQFRGTCFVDLKDAIALSKAHKLHHSKLMDRKINVEPTVGGGGKGENRTKKMEERKREIEKLRKSRLKKEIEAPKTKKTRGFGAQKRSALAQQKSAGEHKKKSAGSKPVDQKDTGS